MTSISGLNLSASYNFLDLPYSITANGSISVTYDANGKKLKQVTTQGQNTDTRYYMDGIEFRDDTLKAIYHEEGRIVPAFAKAMAGTGTTRTSKLPEEASISMQSGILEITWAILACD